MFKIFTSLFFRGDEDAHQDLKSGEVVDDEGWLLVNHTEAVNEVSSVAADQDTEHDDSSVRRAPSNPAVNEETDADLENDIRATILSIHSTASQARALAKMTQVTRVQRAHAWVDRHQLSRNCIQRQNCVYQRAQCQNLHMRSTYLHQPGHRNSTH